MDLELQISENVVLAQTISMVQGSSANVAPRLEIFDRPLFSTSFQADNNEPATRSQHGKIPKLGS